MTFTTNLYKAKHFKKDVAFQKEMIYHTYYPFSDKILNPYPVWLVDYFAFYGLFYYLNIVINPKDLLRIHNTDVEFYLLSSFYEVPKFVSSNFHSNEVNYIRDSIISLLLHYKVKFIMIALDEKVPLPSAVIHHCINMEEKIRASGVEAFVPHPKFNLFRLYSRMV
jgi:hypothetical protein